MTNQETEKRKISVTMTFDLKTPVDVMELHTKKGKKGVKADWDIPKQLMKVLSGARVVNMVPVVTNPPNSLVLVINKITLYLEFEEGENDNITKN